MTTRRRIAIFSDFNGTVTDRDMLAALLTSYDHEALLARITAARNGGLLSLRERVALEAKALTCSPSEADARLSALVTIDTSFLSFFRRCVADGISLVIVSSGIEPLINQMLERYGVDTLPVFADEVQPRPDGWLVKFRDDSPDGNAKRPYVDAAARDGYRTVVIGEDESDFEMALAADVRFAKRDAPFHAIDSFDDVYRRLAAEHLFAP
jgi:2-hydroxy-3-keto-5-methylthiopentenyl-1-phosphate phosphatase